MQSLQFTFQQSGLGANLNNGVGRPQLEACMPDGDASIRYLPRSAEEALQDPASFDVVLLPTFAQVEDWRKRQAGQGRQGLFAQTVSTFNAWMADLWELHGDGRALVDPLQRQVVMQAAFDQLAGVNADGLPTLAEEGALTLSPGVVALAANCVRDAAGVPAFQQALEQAGQGVLPKGLVAREGALLQGIARYGRLLADAGMVELGTAAAYLAANQRSVFPQPLRVLVDEASPLGWVASAFFGACNRLQVCVRLAAGNRAIGRVAPEVGLTFGFPAGRYAQPALVADLICGRVGPQAPGQSQALSDTLQDALKQPAPKAGEGRFSVVVAGKDPLALYKQLESPLSQAGFRVCVQAQVPFGATDFGRQFLETARVVHDDPWAPDDLSDAVRPPYSGFSASDAVAIDKELRANRLAEREECLARLRVASDAFSQLEELASDPEADILLGVFEQIAFTTPGRSQAWRAEQVAAASALRACTAAARCVGASLQSCVQVLENVKVGVSYQGETQAPAFAGRVLVTSQNAAAALGAGASSALVVCDLTSEDYPVADKDDAAATLFAKLGLAPADSALARARRTFTALQSLPARQIAFVRPLNDWDGNPTYACAVLQELIDAYCDGETSDADVHEVLGLPDNLMRCAVQRGEELLVPNFAAEGKGYAQASQSCDALGWGSPEADGARSLVALARRSGRGKAVAFSPSPSQVEAYLECPRKWFVQSRLNVEGLDEGFGALERGSFAHSVLQRFYQEFQVAGQLKVLPENMAQARQLMRRVAEGLAAGQRDLPPGGGRYVAATQIEQREVESCIDQLVSYLDFESRLLPGFHPAYFEYGFKPEDGVAYAGHPFVGIVDRIDVDDAGNAVVIDYKGSVGKAHCIAGKTDTDPGKVQTRMYAQVVGRGLGLNVVGALYVSYGKRHACAGAFDSRALEAAHLPGMKVEACSCTAADPLGSPEDHAQLTFGSMLDRTEQVVAQAMARMEQGIVAPSPSNHDVCGYCPASHCPERSK